MWTQFRLASAVESVLLCNVALSLQHHIRKATKHNSDRRQHLHPEGNVVTHFALRRDPAANQMQEAPPAATRRQTRGNPNTPRAPCLDPALPKIEKKYRLGSKNREKYRFEYRSAQGFDQKCPQRQCRRGDPNSPRANHPAGLSVYRDQSTIRAGIFRFVATKERGHWIPGRECRPGSEGLWNVSVCQDSSSIPNMCVGFVEIIGLRGVGEAQIHACGQLRCVLCRAKRGACLHNESVADLLALAFGRGQRVSFSVTDRLQTCALFVA